MPNATPQVREKNAESIALILNEHLKTKPGTVLSARVRLGICQCARYAFFSPGCDDLPQKEMKFDKSVHVLAVMKNIDHGENMERFFPDLDTNAVRFLVAMIHTIVRHQGRINKDWSNDCIEAFETCKIVDTSDSDEWMMDGVNTKLMAAFCEVVVLTSASTGVMTQFTVAGKEPPALPAFDDIEDAPAPLELKFPLFVGKIRKEENISPLPFFSSGDVNRDSPYLVKKRADAHMPKQVADGLYKMLYHSWRPHAVCCWAPTDLVFMMGRIAPLIYLQMQEVRDVEGVLTDSHCEGVLRSDLEVVGTYVPMTLACAF